jgi:hypothetical protein
MIVTVAVALVASLANPSSTNQSRGNHEEAIADHRIW